MLGILRRFNIDRGFQLGIQIGIHSGDILAGIVGKSRVVYDVWGETVKQAHALSQICSTGSVVVSDVVHHRLTHPYPTPWWRQELAVDQLSCRFSWGSAFSAMTTTGPLWM